MSRRPLGSTRDSVTHRFSITASDGGEVRTHVFYLQVGLYPDGSPGELFITMKNERGTMGAMLDAMAIAFSIALQHGASIDTLCEKFRAQRFYPAGHTSNKDIPRTTSPVDYIAKYCLLKWGKKS